MIPDLPLWVSILFLITWLVTMLFFYYATGKTILLTLLIALWSLLNMGLAYIGFYLDAKQYPFKFLMVLFPSIGMIVYALKEKNLSWIIKKRNLQVSTFTHVVRIPVEICLLYLFYYKYVPKIMTFEGWNFDILVGITAFLVGVLNLKKRLSRKFLLVWNIMGLILVSFILCIGIFSGDLPLQLLAFEQPNRAVLYFPFILLPATIVPIVVYIHLTDIFKILKEEL